MARIVPPDYQTIQRARRGFVAAPQTDVGKTVQDIGGVVNLAEHFVNPLVGGISRAMYNPEDTIAAYQKAYPQRSVPTAMPAGPVDQAPIGINGQSVAPIIRNLMQQYVNQQPPVAAPGPSEPAAPQMAAPGDNTGVPRYAAPSEPVGRNMASAAMSLAQPQSGNALDQNVTPLRFGQMRLDTPQGLVMPGTESPLTVDTARIPKTLAGTLTVKRLSDPRFAPTMFWSDEPTVPLPENWPDHKPAEEKAMVNAGIPTTATQPTAQPAAQPTAQPVAQPAAQPTAQPTAQPQVFRPSAPAEQPVPYGAGQIPTTFNDAKAMVLQGAQTGNHEMVQRALRAFQVGNGLDVVPQTWQEALTGAHKQRAFNELTQLAHAATPHGQPKTELENMLTLMRVIKTGEGALDLQADNPVRRDIAQNKKTITENKATITTQEAKQAPVVQEAKKDIAVATATTKGAEALHKEELERAKAKKATIEADAAKAKSDADLALKKAQAKLTSVNVQTVATGDTAKGRNDRIRAQAALIQARASASHAASYKDFVKKYSPYTGSDRLSGMWNTEQKRLEAELRKYKAEESAQKALLAGQITDEVAQTLNYKDAGQLTKNLAQAKLTAKKDLARAQKGIEETQAAIDVHKEVGAKFGVVSISTPAAPAVPAGQPTGDTSEPQLP